MGVLLYARASSDRQADKGLSIPGQLRELRHHCEKHDLVVLKEFADEGISGTTDQRPGFQGMVSYCGTHKGQVEAVLVWKYNRFSRDRIHAAVYKKHLRDQGVNVISITEPLVDSIDGELLEAVVEAVDSRFSKSLAQDVMRGIREVAKRGYYPLSAAPLGYRKEVIQDGKAKRFRLTPDEGTAQLVRHIFDLYVTQGQGAKTVAVALNEEGLTTPTGKLWSTKGVLRVIENCVYIGTLRIEFTTSNARYLPADGKSIEIEDAFPPIIEKALFLRAQALREERTRTPPRELGSEYLLSGLLRCQLCGSRLYGVAAKSSRHFYYTCKRFYESGKAECDFGFVNRDRLDAVVLEKVRDVLLEEENLRQLAQEVNRELGDSAELLQKERALVQSQLQEKRQQIERLIDAIERGGVDGLSIKQRLQARQKEAEKLAATLDELTARKKGGLVSRLDLDRIRPYVESIQETLATAPTKTQRLALKSFIREIRVSKGQLEIEFSIPQPETLRQEGTAPGGAVLCTVTPGTGGGT